MAMGLGSKFFKRKRRAQKPSHSNHNNDNESCNNIKQLDYDSLRLLQHSIIPLLWSCGLKVQGKPTNSQTEIEATVALNSVTVKILKDTVNSSPTNTPELLISNFLFKCKINSESFTEGTCSLLFDMEKSLQLVLEGSEQHQRSRTTVSRLKTCSTIDLATCQFNASIPLLHYISVLPVVKKSWTRTKPSSVAERIEDNFDEPDAGNMPERLDQFSHALVLALMEKEENDVTDTQPTQVGLQSSLQQPSLLKPPTTTSSLDVLLHAEEGRGLDTSGYSHAYNSNQLRAPTGSGSDSFTAMVSDDTVNYCPPPVRTPSPQESTDHHPLGDSISTQHDIESSANANSMFVLIKLHEIVLSGEVFPFKTSLTFQEFTGSVNMTSDYSQRQQQYSKGFLFASTQNFVSKCTFVLLGIMPNHVSVSGALQETSLKLFNVDL